MISSLFGIFVFCLYSIGILVFGYYIGYNTAINDMKKIRNRK